MKPILRALMWLPFEIFRAVSLTVFRLAGWRVEGALPPDAKLVLIAAPHTSNWDLPFMLCVAVSMRRRIHWMGKAPLFKPPFGWFMRAIGGIPVDRNKKTNAVDQMVETYNAADRLVVAIAPEGSRGKARYWKTGFYNIANGAGVRLSLGFLDYARKVGGVGMTISPTGDYDADLEAVKKFYAGVAGRHPDRTEHG